MNNFASMLKYLRNREGLSQRELASKLNISASAICMYENGNRHPKPEDEEAIADFFNVDLNTLRGRRTYESADYEEIVKAMKLFNAYEQANPEIKAAIEHLLKIKESIPVPAIQPPEIPQLSEGLKSLKSQIDIPHLKKDTDK